MDCSDGNLAEHNESARGMMHEGRKVAQKERGRWRLERGRMTVSGVGKDDEKERMQ